MRRNQNPTPEWKKLVDTIKKEGFSNPWQGAENEKKYMQQMSDVLKAEDKMHFRKPDMLPYISYGDHSKVKGQDIPDYSKTNQVKIPESMSNNQKVTDRFLSHLFDKHNNPLHPFFVPNVLPPVNIASILAAVTALKLNPNMVDEHYSNNSAKVELELASMVISQLSLSKPGEIPKANQWPPIYAPPPPDSKSFYTFTSCEDCNEPSSGGITTFGGTGCYLYAIKYFLTKMVNSGEEDGYDSRADGFEKGKFVVIVSDQGHYCSSNVTDWSGIGHRNVIPVETDPDNNMILASEKNKKSDLKNKLEEAKKNGKVVVAVVGTFGTTDANALEDIKGIWEILDKFENIKNPKTQKQYRKPFLYADSVIGWIWLLFSDYDFGKNPLGFENPILNEIKENAEKAKFLTYSDAFSADFHKMGYSYYPASMIMLKNYCDFWKTMERPPSPYLQPEQYDPSLFTLETSRSVIGALGPWAAFYYFGKNGMRALIYNLMDTRNYFREKLLQTKCAVICNPNNKFYSTLFRLYPYENSNLENRYSNEMNDYNFYEHFKSMNEFQRSIYNLLYKNLRMDSNPGNPNTPPHLSLSTGFRKTYYHYDHEGIDSNDQPLQGVNILKCFINTPFLDHEFVDKMIENIIKIKNECVEKWESARSQYPDQKMVIPGDLPKGADIYNNLVEAKFIPIHEFKI